MSLQIPNSKSEIRRGWSTRPGSHETRCQMGRSEKGGTNRKVSSMMKSEFETWPATPVEASLEINELPLRYGTSRSCFFSKKGAAGVGRPFEKRTSAVRDRRPAERLLLSVL
jgi:hypothetical protein